ncbi:MAG: OmpA family protein [Melioribacteraceae bacterium]
MKLFTILALLTLVLFSTNIDAQFKGFGLKGGFQVNGVMPATEFEDDNGMSLSSYLVRAFLRYEISDLFNAELGAGYGNLKGDDFNYATMARGTGEYSTSVVPIDLRFLMTPFNMDSFNPYFYAGFGAAYYNVNTKPTTVSPLVVESRGWTGVVPVGIGTEIKLSEETLLDISAGVSLMLTENLNYFKIVDYNDAYFSIGLGLTFTGESMDSDKDMDGLTKREEIKIGTDPNNSDSDGDGLKDGEEVKKYNTNPLDADTDNDGLKDGEEVYKYKTSPTNEDTDGDGLKDGEEVMTYKTDPLNADTDSDGLKDGEEILKYKTSPLNADTDGDNLKDGDEVMKYKTDPLKADTDGGTVYDGVEVNRGTNPLDPSDDVAISAMMIQKLKTFDNVLFDVNKAELTEDYKAALDNVYDVCSKLKDAKIQLAGHTSSPASEEYNMELSVRRVNAVKDYLVDKGFKADMIFVEAFGETKPVATNDTEEGKAQNRRTEIKVAYLDKQ